MITIGRRFTFDAAHRLPRHEGKCSRLHGHTYTLEVEICGALETRPISEQGMVLDYATLKKIVEYAVLKTHDHYNLNDVYDGAEENNITTAELLVTFIAIRLRDELEVEDVQLKRVRLSETDNTWAVWEESNVSR